MKVSVKSGKPCEKILNIEVDQDAVQKEYDLFYRHIAPQAKIPGFRPGKAPRNVLETHYAHEARERVLKNLISDSFKEALQDSALHPLLYPKIQDVDFSGNRLTYKAHIEVRPKIKLSRVKGLSAKKESAEVKDDEINEELKRLQESLVQFKAIEDRPSQMGDVVIADYRCVVDGKEIDKRTDDWLEIKEDAFLKDFTNQLIGLKAGDKREAQVVLPENLGRKELAGKTAVFHVEVKDLKAKILPEINDDLAKETGEHNTLAELKEKIRKEALARKEREKEAAYETALLEDLMKHNKIDLPEGLVQKRLEYLLEDAKKGFLNQGAPEAEFEKQKEKLTAGMEPEAKKQVHLAFLLDEIAIQENIRVEDSDLNERFEQMAVRVKQPVEKVREFYQTNENARESLAEQVRNEKTISYIKQHAKQKR